MGFGALYLLACSGALVELYRFTIPSPPSEPTPGHPPSQERFLRIYLLTMVVLAWVAVLTGAYVIYPWYRATPPPGTADLSMFPQRLLMSNPTTIGWHSLGMEWKEHARLARSHLAIHHGRIRLHQVFAVATSGTTVSFCAAVHRLYPGVIHRRWDLQASSRRDAQQERAGPGRTHDSTQCRSRKSEYVKSLCLNEPPARTNGSSGVQPLFFRRASARLLLRSFARIAADKSAAIKSSLIFYKPTGPLSGVTTVAILIWLFTWVVLEWRWRQKTVALARINIIAFLLLGLGFLLTFPPIADIF